MGLSKKWKIILPTAGVVTAAAIAAPTAILLSQGTTKKNQANDNDLTHTPLKPIKVETPDSLIPNSRRDPGRYDYLKEEQAKFTETGKNKLFSNKYTLENRYCIFVFDDDLFTPDYIGTHEEAKEFAAEAMKNTLITGFGVGLGKIIIEVNKSSGELFAGKLPHNGLFYEMKLYWKAGNTQKDMIDTFSHEWGHYETIFHSNNNTNFAIKTYTAMMNEIHSKHFEFPLSFFGDIDGFYKKAQNGEELKGIRSAEIFSNEFDWTRGKSTSKSLGELDWDNLTTWRYDLLPNDFSNFVAELLTRLQIIYTYDLLGDYEKLMSSMQNMADLFKMTNYNFFDPNDGLQSYDWVKSMLENVYQMNGKIHVIANPSIAQPKKIIMNGGGNKAFDDVTSVILLLANGTTQKIDIKQIESPIGFHKNPFASEYEYKYVVKEIYSEYVEITNWDNSSDISQIINIKFLDSQGSELNIDYDLCEVSLEL